MCFWYITLFFLILSNSGLFKCTAPGDSSKTFVYDQNYKNIVSESNITNCKSAYCTNQYNDTIFDPNSGLLNKLKACGKTYYYNYLIKVNYNDNWVQCCIYDLIPMSLDSVTELKCIAQAIPNVSGLYTAITDTNMDQSFTSCITSKKITKDLWSSDVTQSKYESCMIYVNKSGVPALQPFNCLHRTGMACQETNQSPIIQKSNRYNEITMNLLKDTGILECKYATCNNIEVPASETWKVCCDVGMTPLTLNNRAEYNCLQKVYKKYMKGQFGSESFFTSYIDINLNKSFISCSNRQKVQPLLWKHDEPNNFDGREPIGAVFFSLFETGGMIDISCDPNKMLRVICEKFLNNSGPTITAKSGPNPVNTIQLQNLNINVTIPNKTKMDIPNTRYNEKTLNNFKESGLFDCKYAVCNNIEDGKKKFQKISGTSNHGLPIITGCNNKIYFIPDSKVTANETFKTCCEFGMTPLTLNTKPEMICLQTSFAKFMKGELALAMFYTSYIDVKCDIIFKSCSNGIKLSSTVWKLGEPDNKNRAEPCVGVSLKQNEGMFDAECGTKGTSSVMRVVCEMNDTKSISTVKPVTSKPIKYT